MPSWPNSPRSAELTKRCTSAQDGLACRVQLAQLDAGVLGGPLPLDGFGVSVAVAAPGGHFGGHPGLFREAAVQALPGQDTQLALGHVEPTAVGRRVVPLETGRQAVGRLRVEGLVEGLGRVRVEVVADQDDLLGFGEVDLRQLPQHVGAVHGRAPCAHLDLAPAQQGRGERVF